MERVTRRGMMFLLSIFVLLTLLMLTVVLPFLAFVFFGAFAAFLVWPLHQRLRGRIPERLSASLLVFGVYAVIFIPLTLLAFSVLQDLGRLVRRIRVEGAESLIAGFVNELFPEDIAEHVIVYLVRVLAEAAQAIAPQLVGHFLDILLGTFIFGFVLYYVLLHGDGVKDFVRGLIPLRAYRVKIFFDNISQALNAVFYGVLIVAIVQGAAGGIVWWIAGLPNPFFYGAVMFVLSILPFAGPSFLLLPVAIWHFAQGEVGMGVFLAVSAVILVGGIDNVSRPFLVGKFGKINPALVVVGLAGGLVAFGIVGVVLGPLIFALWVAVAKELRTEIEIWKHETFNEEITEGAVSEELLEAALAEYAEEDVAAERAGAGPGMAFPDAALPEKVRRGRGPDDAPADERKHEEDH